MKGKFWLFLFSGALIINGILIMVTSEPTLSWDFFGDIYDVKLSKEKWIIGPCFVLWGLYGVIKTSKSNYIETHYKCLNCGEIFKLEKSTDHLCKVCNGPLEELKGFFDRHPEFKDDSHKK